MLVAHASMRTHGVLLSKPSSQKAATAFLVDESSHWERWTPSAILSRYPETRRVGSESKQSSSPQFPAANAHYSVRFVHTAMVIGSLR
mmetsp:Transcript_26035/g.52149  ORF Transcript_26035/g.52149 Transcript_26035/m.52149 type:complete len:88 (+) Transcript_26035:4554-4817(+)